MINVACIRRLFYTMKLYVMTRFPVMMFLGMQLGSQVGQCSTQTRANWEHMFSISVFSGDSRIVCAAITGNHVGGECQVSHMAWSHCYDPFYGSWCLLHCLLGCHKPIIRGNCSFIFNYNNFVS